MSFRVSVFYTTAARRQGMYKHNLTDFKTSNLTYLHNSPNNDDFVKFRINGTK